MTRTHRLAHAGLVLALTAGNVESARGQDKVKFEDLQAPTSPAFVLMGIEPKTVERPKLPRAFVASLLQATDQFGGLPKNFAMEFAPYWLVPHPDLEFQPDVKEPIGKTFIQTLSLSLAAATDSAAARTSVGLGLRALLARGRTPAVARAQMDSIRALHHSILDADTETEENAFADRLSQLNLRLQRNLYMQGFRLEVAAAGVGDFEEGSFGSGEFSRLGIWVTPSYQLARPKLDLSGVLRVIFNEGDRSGTSVDYGTRFSYDVAPITVSYELVGRATIDATITNPGPGPNTGTFTLENTYRSAGSLEYAFGGGSSVAFSFGRNFKEPGKKDLIATVSLNLGFGVVPLIKVNR